MVSGRETLQEALVESFALEKGMRRFYEYAERQAEGGEALKTFRKLRDWEERHMMYIESLYQALMGERDLLSYEAFSEKMTSDHIESGIPLRDAQDLFHQRSPGNETEIITLAIELEEKACGFYRDLSQSAEDPNARVVFEDMMEQEKKHISGLKSLQKKY